MRTLLLRYLDFLCIMKSRRLLIFYEDRPDILCRLFKLQLFGHPQRVTYREASKVINGHDKNTMETTIADIHCGVLKRSILLKVDGMILNEGVRTFASFSRALKDLVSMDMVFFKTKSYRILGRLDNEEVMQRFSWRFGEGGCYKVTDCKVEHEGFGVHERYHISFVPGTMVAEDFSADMPHHYSSSGGFFFVHEYGGTGKSFLWSALASTLRARGQIVLTVASSGIAGYAHEIKE
ncbi:hypothetical protein K1719_003633 [Acacia pycnantha]|nr:hypothetical protein K1719_003633 [Acacia pycnantha]